MEMIFDMLSLGFRFPDYVWDRVVYSGDKRPLNERAIAVQEAREYEADASLAWQNVRGLILLVARALQ